ncbi:MAG: hypothetical protein CSB06_02215 [Bacteroidia bacterium]|nr:MAG: hypothetical protein CSB06_02215 [Bacteroidia bacterium]
MKRFFRYLLIVIVLGAIGFWLFIRYAGGKQKKALSVIPSDAVLIVETENLTQAWQQLREGKIWNYLTQNAYFKQLNEDMELFNTYIGNNAIASQVLKNRSLIMSLHMTSANDYDFLYVADLKKMSLLNQLNLSKIADQVSGYNAKQRKYNGKKILELADPEDPGFIIYLSFSDNLLLATFSASLMEKAIDQKANVNEENPHWTQHADFTSVTERLRSRELFKLYINYRRLNDFSLAFLSEESEVFRILSESLTYSALDADLQDEIIALEGYTGADSVGGYLKALSEVEPGRISAWKIASEQTAAYLSMSFDNFDDFYKKLIGVYEKGNPEELADSKSKIGKLERLLGVNFQETFFNHFDNEIVMLKLRPLKNGDYEDISLLIKMKDIDAARAGLDKIMKRIKRRIMVVKFEPEIYKNHTIYCLEMPGFFKIFFGKMFEELDKPYFTYIENFVVFSNSKPDLKLLIDDYTEGNTLAHNPDFTDFKDNFANKANLSLFVRTPQIYQNLYYHSKPEDRKDITENKEFILSFEHIGFQLISDNQGFKTKLLGKHNPDAEKADKLQVIENEAFNDLFQKELESDSFALKLDQLPLEKDTLYTLKNPNGTLKIEGNIKNGKPQGLWRYYYPSGNLKAALNYTDGILEGTAYFYHDKAGKTLKAEAKYQNGTLHGNYFEFYKNGTQKTRFAYQNGKPEGFAQFFYPDGRKKIEGEYKKGEKHGKWIFFDRQGYKIGKERWRNGKKKK